MSLTLSSAALLFTSLTNLPFPLAASNPILKPGGPLTEVRKIVRLIFPLPDMFHLSLPRPSHEESHLSFCFSFSFTKFFAAASNLSLSTATGTDKVAYPLPNSHPQDGKTSRLSCCVLKLFEHIILLHLLFFLKSNSILSPRQVGFCPGRSILDQILFFSWSILHGFNKPRSDSWMFLSTIKISRKLLTLSGTPPFSTNLFHLYACCARWTLSFLSDRRTCMVDQNHQSRFVRVCRGVLQGSVLGPVLSSIINLPASLPFFISCFVYSDDLTIWSSFPSVPTAVEATQGALIRLEHWSEY